MRCLVVGSLIACLGLMLTVAPGSANIIGGPKQAQPPPQPAGWDPLDVMLDAVGIIPSVSDGPVQFFPLIAPGDVHLSNYLRPLHDAFARGEIEIYEAPGNDQFQLRIANTGNSPVFAQAGNLVGGGGQDRLTRRDMLLPPGGEPINVSVYCAERGRWGGTSDRFGFAGAVATPQLRALAATGTQEEVWADIEEVQRAFPERELGSTSYGAVARSESVAKRLDDVGIAALRAPVTGQDRLGVICAVNGNVIGIDIYGSPDLFQALWPQVLDSYLVEAVRHGPRDGARRATRRDAELALAALGNTYRVPVPSVGLGEAFELHGPTKGRREAGFALFYRGEVVHVALASVTVMPRSAYLPMR